MNNQKIEPASTKQVSCDCMAGQRCASEALFQGMREILIKHAGKVYRLRITRKGKLILTK